MKWKAALDRPCAQCSGEIDFENAPEGIALVDVVLCSKCRKKGHASHDAAVGLAKTDAAVNGHIGSGWRIGRMS